MHLEFNRYGRARVLAMITAGIIAVFILRLFYLQILQHGYYVRLANSEQMKQLVIPSRRGEIYALDHNEPVRLVLNQAVYTVFADPKIVTKPDAVVEAVERVAGGNAKPNLPQLLNRKESRYQILATKVTRKQAELIKKADLRGVGFQEETMRVYPEGQLAAQTLGFVDAEGKGQYGIEGQANMRLAGEDGLLQSVTDISNVPLTIGDNNINRPPNNGDDIVLTLDRNIQAFVEQALAKGLERTGAKRGSVIVMDPQSGSVMAMANLPTYNPAEFTKVQDNALFNNAIISAPYAPGSVIKTLTMSAGVDRGVVRPDSTYENTDRITVGDRTITNLTKGQTGTITFQRALNYSLNTGFVTVAQRLGDGKTITLGARETLHDYFHNKYRLGKTTGIELVGELPGTIMPPNFPNGAAVQYANMTFGQGMDVTMVQVASAFSAMINGGTYHPPTVIAGTVGEDGNLIKDSAKPAIQGLIKKSTSDTMRDMVIEARSAFYASADKPGYQIGGKTGTSEVFNGGALVAGESIGTYLGFGGDNQPRYVIMVQVSGEKMNLEGGKHAMPIFTDLSNWIIDYLQLQPKR